MREKDNRLRQREEELQQKETQLQQKDEELQLRNADISRLQREIRSLQVGNFWYTVDLCVHVFVIIFMLYRSHYSRWHCSILLLQNSLQ